MTLRSGRCRRRSCAPQRGEDKADRLTGDTQQDAADGPEAHADDATRGALRALIGALDPDDLAELRAALADPAASPARRPAAVALAATFARYAALSGSESRRLALKGRRGLAFAERLLAQRADALAQDASIADGEKPPIDRERAIRAIYLWAVGRVPETAEVAAWSENLPDAGNFPNFIIGMAESEEARANQLDPDLELTNGEFAQAMFLTILGAAPLAAEIEAARRRLRAGLSREAFAIDLLRRRLKADRAPLPAPPARSVMPRAEWEERRAALGPRESRDDDPDAAAPAAAPDGRPIVTAVIHVGPDDAGDGPGVEALVADPWFAAHGELILVDEAAPDERSAAFGAVAAAQRNVRHWRLDEEVGRARALNLALAHAHGRYLLLLDGALSPRPGALARQAAALDRLVLADVVYQDAALSYAAGVGYEEAEAIGALSSAPLVTVHTLMANDPLAEAPMWRRSLHGELGPFDPAGGEAAELEFWMRCLRAGKTFYKLSDPFGVRLVAEPWRAPDRRKALARHLDAMPEAALNDRGTFLRQLGDRRWPRDETSNRYQLTQRRLRDLAAALNPSRTEARAGAST